MNLTWRVFRYTFVVVVVEARLVSDPTSYYLSVLWYVIKNLVLVIWAFVRPAIRRIAL